MCGGSLETHPCSHIGHIFRERAPYTHPGGPNVILRNSVRLGQGQKIEIIILTERKIGLMSTIFILCHYLMSFLLTIKPRLKAEVWLDEFKKIFYNRIPAAETVEYGDISDRVSLRQDLHCKSFKWYLDNIYPEMDFAANDDLIHSGAILIQGLRVINY